MIFKTLHDVQACSQPEAFYGHVNLVVPAIDSDITIDVSIEVVVAEVSDSFKYVQ